jgi:hypothetical protein
MTRIFQAARKSGNTLLMAGSVRRTEAVEAKSFIAVFLVAGRTTFAPQAV